MTGFHDQLRDLIDRLSDEDAAKVLAYAQRLGQEAEQLARAARCWSCGKPRDYATHPVCPSCFAPDRRRPRSG